MAVEAEQPEETMTVEDMFVVVIEEVQEVDILGPPS